MTPESGKAVAPVEDRIYWAGQAFSVFGGLREHRASGQLLKDLLTGKREWGNVTQHCLVEVARAEVLGRWLGLAEDVIIDMKTAAVLHDVRKKQEIEATRQAEINGESPIAAYKVNAAKTTELLRNSGFSDRVIRLSTAPGGHASELFETQRILDEAGQLSDENLAYLIVHYVDDCSVGSKWVADICTMSTDVNGQRINIIDYRAAENKAKPAYQKISAEIGEELKGHPVFDGMNNHDAMAQVSHFIEERLAKLIAARTGENTDSLKLPELVDNEIRQAIKLIQNKK